jgi:hypothetical protein
MTRLHRIQVRLQRRWKSDNRTTTTGSSSTSNNDIVSNHHMLLQQHQNISLICNNSYIKRIRLLNHHQQSQTIIVRNYRCNHSILFSSSTRVESTINSDCIGKKYYSTSIHEQQQEQDPQHRKDNNNNTTSTATNTNSTTSRLDIIPNDLTFVVNKILSYLEIYHNDNFIRERYNKNLDHAKRFNVHGHIYHYKRINTDTSNTDTISVPIDHQQPTHEYYMNGINGHSLQNQYHSNDMNGLNGSATDTNHHHSMNGLNGHYYMNGINGHEPQPQQLLDPILNAINGHHHHPMNGTLNGHNNNNNNQYDMNIVQPLSFEEAISDLSKSNHDHQHHHTTTLSKNVPSTIDHSIHQYYTSSAKNMSRESDNNPISGTIDTTTRNDPTNMPLNETEYKDHYDARFQSIISSIDYNTTTTTTTTTTISNKNPTSSNSGGGIAQPYSYPTTDAMLNRMIENNTNYNNNNNNNTMTASTTSSTTNQFAIYHALKNDFQKGGNIESIITLQSKTEKIPFPNIETLIAITSDNHHNTITITNNDNNNNNNTNENNNNNGESNDTITTTAINTGNENLFSSDKLIDTIPFSSIATDPFEIMPQIGNNMFEEDYIEDPSCDTNSSIPLDTLPKHEPNNEPFIEKVFDPTILPNRMNHSEVIQKLSYNSHMGYQPIVDQSLQSWFQTDFLVNNKVIHSQTPNIQEHQNGIVPDHDATFSTITSTASAATTAQINDDQNLQSWFNSDFLDNVRLNGDSSHRLKDYKVESVADTKRNEPSVLEIARRDSLLEAVVLLRSLTEDQWLCFDIGDDIPSDTTPTMGGEPSSNKINGLISDRTDDTMRIVDMLAELLLTTDILPSGKQLTATEYNYSLARMAIATDVAPDEILALLMQTHRQMSELAKAGFVDSGPNSVTHEILLLALVRRFSAFHNAIDLVIALSKSSDFLWSPKTLQAASELCERKDLLRMSRDLMNTIKTLDITRLKIPKRVFISLINVYKDNDARSDAIEMLKLGLKVRHNFDSKRQELLFLMSKLLLLFHTKLQQAAGRSDQLLDEVFVHTIKWPYRNRLAGVIDNSSILADILSLLENETLYVAGFHVWKQLIYTSSKGAAYVPMRFEFVTKSFRYLSVADPTYHPDHLLLRQGLIACDILMDSDLAWDLIRRAITNYSPSQLQISSSPLHLKPHVPFQDFLTGMKICLKVNNMNACENILKISKKMNVTSTNSRSLHVLVLKGYAQAGDTENALKILETMNNEKLSPG